MDKHKQNAIFLFSGGNGTITVDEINRTINAFEKGDERRFFGGLCKLFDDTFC
ncbi:hypothetical protein FACS189468_0990 [Spirochaetia bacterium]|nr:hypothetical protein FACS189468_0990 [Spirochaetia bacterium]